MCSKPTSGCQRFRTAGVAIMLPVAKVLVMMKERDSTHTFYASLCVNKQNVFPG